MRNAGKAARGGGRGRGRSKKNRMGEKKDFHGKSRVRRKARKKEALNQEGKPSGRRNQIKTESGGGREGSLAMPFAEVKGHHVFLETGREEDREVLIKKVLFEGGVLGSMLGQANAQAVPYRFRKRPPFQNLARGGGGFGGFDRVRITQSGETGRRGKHTKKVAEARAKGHRVKIWKRRGGGGEHVGLGNCPGKRAGQ